jgi:branched-chain amino acid transport system substrate-binding protein
MASGAVCTIAYVQAAKNAGSLNPDAVRDALSALDYECFYGHLRFTADGDGDPSLLGALLVQRQAGKLEVIAPADVASAKPIYPAPSWKDRA